MNHEQSAVRLSVQAILLVAFGGPFVFYGASNSPEQNDYSGNGSLEANPTAHVGNQVELTGIIVDTEPLVLEVK